MKSIRRSLGTVRSTVRRSWDRRTLAPLYDPDFHNLDPVAHLTGAVNWLVRAQDFGADRGVAYGVRFGGTFDLSYPETTGYICQTFVELAESLGRPDLFARALEMAHWEAEIQMPGGAVMGGKFNRNPTPAVFNTGMVLLGWAAVLRQEPDPISEDSARAAADWLLSVQEPNGNWIKGNSKFARADATAYNVKAAWGLAEVGVVLGEDRYVDAALRNALFCLSLQQPNGWIANCCLSDPAAPLLHTLAYAMQGLLGVGRITEREELMAGARLLADAQVALLQEDGFLPGQQRSDFSAAVEWCCLTGSAQTSIVWSDLYELTGEIRYRDSARVVNRYLMARHDLRNPDLSLRGGVAGSWPTWGDYGRLMVLNWATKFFADALHRQLVIEGRLGDAAWE